MPVIDVMELQLLVIFFGDACLVKVEKGHMPDVAAPVQLPHSEWFYNHDAGRFHAAIAALRVAVQPSVPRIEMRGNSHFLISADHPAGQDIGNADAVQALRGLAGVEIPIYHAETGTWQPCLDMPDVEWVVGTVNGSGLQIESRGQKVEASIQVWRYTLRAGDVEK